MPLGVTGIRLIFFFLAILTAANAIGYINSFRLID